MAELPQTYEGGRNTLRRVQPTLLRQMNERTVFEIVRDGGPISRAELARRSGMSAPTASKVVANLLYSGLLEEIGSKHSGRGAGRPGKLYRLGTDAVQVLGAVIDVRKCCVVSASLDGQLHEQFSYEFTTPDTYEKLIDLLVKGARRLMGRPNVATLGMGISTPGEIDPHSQTVAFSPNLHMLDGKSPAVDLRRKLSLEAVLFHETVGTCLAERAYGAARGMNDFVMIGTYEGFGVSIVSGGRLIEGKDGMAGEMGHVTVDLKGSTCGCGNRGCLETVATDAAFSKAISKRLGRHVEIEDIIRLVANQELDASAELEKMLSYLAVGVAAAINIFNPEAVLVCSRTLDVCSTAWDTLRDKVRERALQPLSHSCKLIRAEGNTRQGACAAIVYHLTHELGPLID